MKTIILLFCIAFVLVPTSIKAQNICGTICDSVTNEPIPQANISASIGKNVIFRGRSNNEGRFIVESKEAPTSVEFSHVGYNKKNVLIDGNKHDLGVIRLSPVVLAEVKITGSTVKNGIDKDVYIITDEQRKGSMNAGEMLGRLPGVMYNWYNTDISVDGEKNVLLLVDGVEKPSNYIKDINPKKIKSIEIVHNPGGRYLSDNYAAVIDLKLYEDYVGMDLTTNNSLMLRLPRISSWDWMFKENSSINYTHTYNKLTWYAGYELNQKRMKIFEDDYTGYPGYIETGTIKEDDEDNVKNDVLTHKALAGFDYKINKNHTVSGQLTYSCNKSDLSLNDDIWYGVSDAPNKETFQSVDKDDKSDDVVASLFYNGKINERLSIYSDLNYNYYTSDLTASVNQQDLFRNEALLTSRKNYLRYNIDMTYSGKKSSLKLGYSTTWKNYHSKEEKQNRYAEETDNYRNRLFLYYSYNLSKKLSFSVGGATEWAKDVSNLGSEKHFSFFPDAKIMYKPSSKINLTCQYSSTVEYPKLSQTMLNYRMDSMMILQANPELRQMIIHNISAKLRMWNCFSLLSSVQFNPQKHCLYYEKLNDGIVARTYINADYKQYSVGLSFDKMFWRCFYFSGMVSFEHSRINFEDYKDHSNELVGSATLMYMLQKQGLRFIMQYEKNNKKRLEINGYNYRGENLLMVAVSKSFLKNRALIMLGYMPSLRFIEGKNTSCTETSYYRSHNSDNGNTLLRNMVMLRANIRLDYGKRTNKQAHEITVDKETIDQ